MHPKDGHGAMHSEDGHGAMHPEDGHGAMHSEDGHGAMHSEDDKNFPDFACCYGDFRCDHKLECQNVDLDKCGSNDWPEKTDYDCN